MAGHGGRWAKNPPYLPRPTYLFIQGATDPLHLSLLQGSTTLEPKLAHAPQHVGVLTASRRILVGLDEALK